MERTPDTSGRFRRTFVIVLTIGAAVLFFLLIRDFIVSLMMAAVLSATLFPLFAAIRTRMRDRASPAALLTLLVALTLIVIPLMLLLGVVAEQAAQVSQTVSPWLQEQLSDDDGFFRHDETGGEGAIAFELPDWMPFSDQLEPYKASISTKLAEFAGRAGAFLGTALGKITQGTAAFFINLLIMLYAAFFFLVHGREWVARALALVPLQDSDRQKLLEVGASVSRATIKGTLAVGVLQGILNGIGFAVAGIEAAVFWGAIMAVLSVVPSIGTALVWGPAVLFLLFSGQTLTAVALLVWCGVLVGTVDNVIRPMVVGRDTRMPDLLIVVSTLGGLGLYGVPGLILGPMIAALFLSVLAIYSKTFAIELNLESTADDSESLERA